MNSVIDVLLSWKRTAPATAPAVTHATARRTYRLREWPHLVQNERKAGIFRTLSMMSHTAVDRGWMLAQSKLPARELDPMLKHWIDSGWVEAIESPVVH
ncbi:MAG TPA: hypothetical protein VHA82_19485 [Ramlibacter sp.]|uniref:hypothetical protein n=1 Tax=Ramlibacter sp. TaxID=1917967 RepID=UPI002CA3D993|nr:hypothetical protein [Ramlibacter sp.]HVZ46000.1 hypothetical protein [Ramlibacter sp.]